MSEVLLEARQSLAEEWYAANPVSPNDIFKFYENAQGLKADLDAWHDEPFRQRWTDIIIAAAKTANVKRVLDVGAGVGHDLMALRQSMPDVWVAAVEPNKLAQLHLSNAGIPFAPSIDETEGDVDMVICIDVIEHLPDPDSMIDAIAARLPVGGIFVESTEVEDRGTPLHLDSLLGYSPGRRLDHWGFKVEEQVSPLRIWRRVSDQRVGDYSVLFCSYRSLSNHTAIAMNKLSSLGWRYNIHGGDALISRVRSIAVSNWIRNSDTPVFLMVDDDIEFNVEDAKHVADLALERGIACGAYAKHDASGLAVRGKGIDDITFGPNAQPIEIEYASTGFLACRRDVIEALIATVPLCHGNTDWPFWPIFQPIVQPFADHYEYLSEDWAMCQRAMQLGYKIWLDPSVILTHYGQVGYTIYDIAAKNSQMATIVPATEVIG